jgi:hypothetical protein
LTVVTEPEPPQADGEAVAVPAVMNPPTARAAASASPDIFFDRTKRKLTGRS